MRLQRAGRPMSYLLWVTVRCALRLPAISKDRFPRLWMWRVCVESLLAEALDAGATGFSTGLMYAPGSSAPGDELERLCRVVAKKNKIYTSHIRTYFAGLVACS